MAKARDLHNIGPAPPSVIPEYKLWEEHWCKYDLTLLILIV